MSKAKTYHIHKGAHKSGLHFKPLYNCTEMVCKVEFNKTFYKLYEEGDAGEDVNRLFGFSRGLQRKNSASFGFKVFKTMPYTLSIGIFSNQYTNGIRTSRLLKVIKPQVASIWKPFYMGIQITNEFTSYYLYNNRRDYLAHDLQPTLINAPSFGYKLHPFFGDFHTAPHSFNVKIETV